MQLFLTETHQNLLPYDGEVIDFGYVYDLKTADIIFDYLLKNTPWQPDEFFKTFGTGSNAVEKHILTNRNVAWYAEQAKSYTYAGSTKTAHVFSPALLKLKQKVEQITQATYNACLLNLYHNGAEGMTWHSDNEKEIVKGCAIASLSFGAERKFMLKHKKTKQRIDVWLGSGQLIVMKGATQTHWLHSVPKSTKVTAPRINLTFRTVV